MAKKILHRTWRITCLCVVFFLVCPALPAQKKYQRLEKLDGEKLSCYFSTGSEEKARKIAAFCAKAMEYFTEVLNFTPEIDVLVLNQNDWSDHTFFPVYGMPHYTDKKTLIVASDDNPFWQSFIPAEGILPPSIMTMMEKVYRNDQGETSMEPFFQLLVIHELGHAYSQQAGISMQRQWLGEFFCNLMLHTFVAEKYPAQLPALTLFPQIVINGGKEGYEFTTLDQLENNYVLIGTKHPKNYGWYQSLWHKGAADVYDAGGKEVLLKFWNAFKAIENEIKEEDLASILENNIHPSLARFYKNWNDE
ncbi:MAG: hypothetical protein H0U44_05045 [Flavisolibacter sp.]|jgi:hypothetical protein|nr:hypothetical protein [Flavisolibacter sp.]